MEDCSGGDVQVAGARATLTDGDAALCGVDCLAERDRSCSGSVSEVQVPYDTVLDSLQ